ncbi:MAG: alpha/beta hydrolase [Anaerorhabdus sp.]
MAENKKLEKAIAVVAGVTVAIAAAYCTSCVYVFSKIFKRKKESPYLNFSNALPNKLENDFWFENIKKEKQWILGEKDMLLHAVSLRNERPSHRWVICAHGYGFYGTQILDLTRKFYDQGYHCLLPDFRAHGESEGQYSTLGWKEREEVQSWINWIIKEDPSAEIVLHGVSIGANAVLNAAGENLPSNVKCIISDSAYSTLTQLLKYQIEQYLKLPLNILIPGVTILASWKAKFSVEEANTIEQVKKIKIPVLFIHGESDSFVPSSMVFDLFYECNTKKDLVTYSQGRHADAFLQYDYFEKVINFIKSVG